MKPGDPMPVETYLSPDQAVEDLLTRPTISPLIVTIRALGRGKSSSEGMFRA